MKNVKRIFSLALALMLVLSLATTAFAEEAEGVVPTGSITINNATNVTVEGKTFKAYKILDLQIIDEDYVYTIPTQMLEFYTSRYADLDSNAGDFTALVMAKIAAEEDMFAFAAAALEHAKKNSVTPATGTAEEKATSVVINNLPLGYYVIEDEGTTKPISALMLQSTNPDVAVTIKADKPSITKKIDGDADTDENTSGDVDANNAAVGDKVPYVLTTKVPDMTGYTKYFYVVTDTLSKGLTFNNDVVITVNGDTKTVNTDYTVTSTDNEDGTTTVKIVFKNFIQYNVMDDPTTEDADEAVVGKDIIITYSATVDTDAVIGDAGNPNEVKLVYSNNPQENSIGKPENPDEPDEQDPVGETPKDYTRTYVTEVILKKVDPAQNYLTGAEFTITGTKLNTVVVKKETFVKVTEDMSVPEGTTYYWLLKDGKYTTTDPTTEDVKNEGYASTTDKYIKKTNTNNILKSEDVSYTAEVGEDGFLTFSGLAAGEYTITEIKAPDGYNLLEDPIEVEITCTLPSLDADGKGTCTWEYEWTVGAENVDSDNSSLVTTNSNIVTVENNAGTELPSTGGVGTTMFYIIGSILVLASIVMLVTKKRMGSAE